MRMVLGQMLLQYALESCEEPDHKHSFQALRGIGEVLRCQSLHYVRVNMMRAIGSSMSRPSGASIVRTGAIYVPRDSSEICFSDTGLVDHPGRPCTHPETSSIK